MADLEEHGSYRRARLDEVDRLLPADTGSAGAQPLGKHTGVSASINSTSAPPRLRQALFFATYIFYYAANTLMGPLLPSSKQLNRVAIVTLCDCLVWCSRRFVVTIYHGQIRFD